MNVSLTPELEKYVQDKVASGLYTSASEVVRESLRLMHTADDYQHQHISQLNQAIQVGISQLQSGKKVSPSESYSRLKNKIENIAKDSE